MTIDLYYVPTSPPVRIVRLVATAVDIPLNPKLVNLKAGEQLEPEFLKKNIQHTAPTIDDNGFYLPERLFPVVFSGASFDPADLVKIDEAFGSLNSFLEGQEYVSGKNLNIADLALIASISTYDGFDYDLSKYENAVRWYSHLKETAPQYDEANGNGVEELCGNSAVLLRKRKKEVL